MENFSPASETNPLKIKLSARAELRPGLKKSPCNRNEISARAEKQQEIIWLPDSPETLRAQFYIWCRD